MHGGLLSAPRLTFLPGTPQKEKPVPALQKSRCFGVLGCTLRVHSKATGPHLNKTTLQGGMEQGEACEPFTQCLLRAPRAPQESPESPQSPLRAS